MADPRGGRPARDRTPAVVRVASAADHDAIAELTDLVPATRRLLAAALAEPSRRHVLVATDGPGGDVLGLVVGTRQADAVHVLDVVVDRSSRRRGIATELVRELARAALGDGTPAMTLEVRAGDDGARALYERLGFRDAGVRPGYYQDGEDAHVLWHHDPASLGARSTDLDRRVRRAPPVSRSPS